MGIDLLSELEIDFLISYFIIMSWVLIFLGGALLPFFVCALGILNDPFLDPSSIVVFGIRKSALKRKITIEEIFSLSIRHFAN